MEYRNIHHHAGIEESTPVLLESILNIRIGHRIRSHQSYFRHHVGSCHPDFSVIDLRGQLKALCLRPVGIYLIQILVRTHLRDRNVGEGFVSKYDLSAEIKTYLLAEKHFGKSQAIVGLGFEHVRLVGFHLYLESIRLRGHTFLDKKIHIVLHLVKKVSVGVGEFFLVGDGDDLPICLVNINYNLLVLLVVLGL